MRTTPRRRSTRARFRLRSPLIILPIKFRSLLSTILENNLSNLLPAIQTRYRIRALITSPTSFATHGVRTLLYQFVSNPSYSLLVAIIVSVCFVFIISLFCRFSFLSLYFGVFNAAHGCASASSLYLSLRSKLPLVLIFLSSFSFFLAVLMTVA
ncbi:hypothetical protein SERLA73DRAFT_190830, partial [Serpula lacrymans var. lacrymans S7.3]